MLIFDKFIEKWRLKKHANDDYLKEVKTAEQGGQLSSEKVARYYDEWTPLYMEGFEDNTFQSQRTDNVDDLFNYIIGQAEIKPGSRILDAGCGIGGPAMHIQRLVNNISIEGITISSVQAELAQKSIADKGLTKHFRVRQGDFHYLDTYYDANSFDAVLFLESLVHSDHPLKVLQGAFKVLKPGGVLYMKDLFRRVAADPDENEHVKKVIRNVNKYFSLRIKPKELFIKHLKEAGFEFRYIREMEIDTNHDIGNAFCAKHNIDIYEGRVVTFLEWLELKAVKPR